MSSRFYVPYSQDGETSQRLCGTSFFDVAELGGSVVVGVGVGVTVTRGPFTHSGFNSFMMIVASVTNANVTFQYNHLDPVSGAILFTRTVATLAVSAVPLIATWGAYAAVGLVDTFVRVSYSFVNTSGALSPTVASPRIWTSVR
jgi:hypothetical protein